ncbi:hypothetical protein B0O99DRAFT_623006 [Bisporella sp. PMI_857]|nr:hypothetical protein B0O99DRAFT_623006 [Bisporella sp. PMI_857]
MQKNFGQTPLWWARRTGHHEIADLLLEKYRENGMVVQKDDSPIRTISVSDNKSNRYCDVCMLRILDRDMYYHCRVCNSGDFDICEECVALKAHCLDQSAHTLIKEVNT